MSKPHTEINEEFVHHFIEILSEKTEEIKESFGGFSDLENNNPLNFVEKIIFPNGSGFREPGIIPPTDILHPSGFPYDAESGCDYLYGFTNSEFLAFLGNLCPTDLLIIIGLIAILIAQSLNLNELTVVSSILEGIAELLEVYQEMAEFQKGLKEEEQSKKQNQAIQQDFDFINQQLCLMQQQIIALQNQLQHKADSCKSPHTPTPYSSTSPTATGTPPPHSTHPQWPES